MGHKTHPKGFRLISTQKHLSTWYKNKHKYASTLEEDNFIRIEINKIFKDYLNLENITISRIVNLENSNEYINITINTLHPRIKECFNKILKYSIELNFNFFLNIEEKTLNNKIINKKIYLEQQIKKCNFLEEDIANTFYYFISFKLVCLLRYLLKKLNKIIFIDINLIKNIFDSATLIAKYICEKLLQRLSFKYIIKDVITNIKKTNKLIEGLKIQISGRLNGNDIANTEWKKYKKMPLHTIFANIDYANETAKTSYGLLGIKVWIYIK